MCQLHGLTIHNRRIKVGWGKHSGPLSNALSLAVSNGASRNIYIGNIVDFEYFNPAKLREDFTKFGDIEQINYLEEKIVHSLISLILLMLLRQLMELNHLKITKI